jgi:hypothetical protein
MALLNFPPNPNPGDKFTIGTITWQWNGAAWIKFNDPNKTFGQVTSTAVVITSTSTSSLQVTGGAIISGDLFVGGNLVGPGAAALSTATDNVRGGTTGSILYQLAPGLTKFIGIGSTGSLLVSNGTTATFSNTLNSLVVSGTASPTQLDTGTAALKVAGGVSIGGDLWLGGQLFSQGSPVLTTATFGAVISAGQDITISFVTGTNYIQVNDVATLQTVTGRGSTTSNRINITNTVSSTSTTTGALVVKGGVGIGGDVNVWGRVSAESVRVMDAIFDSTKTSISSQSITAIDQYRLSDYRTAKYLVQIDEGTGASADFQSSEISLLATNTGTVYLTEYGKISSKGNVYLGNFTAAVENIGGSDFVRLFFQADQATSKVISVLRISMVP